MDENEAAEEDEAGEAGGATPIFSVYRRGYDPEQVDRYVGDQQRRLDEAVHRASESERKLAAAVGQLRELHRRVAVYESEARNAQPPQLDTLGERVQRILQEAWEGAYNLRQEAEREVTELRDRTQQEAEALRTQARADVDELRDVASREAAEVIDEATQRALHVRDETERRRQAYLERVERDREQAIAQITYLYDQRQGAIAELARLQASVQATVEEMVRSPLGRPAPGVMEAAGDGVRSARASSGRAHPTGPSSALTSGVGPAVPGPDAGSAPGKRPAGERPPGKGGARAEPVGSGVASAHLPGILGEPGTAEVSSEMDLPTGSMERLARPADREAARAARRSAGSEANAMERMIREGSAAGPARGEAQGAVGQHAGPEALGLEPPADDAPGTVWRSHASGATKAGAMLGGLIRPRRHAPSRGVYDAEQDG